MFIFALKHQLDLNTWVCQYLNKVMTIIQYGAIILSGDIINVSRKSNVSQTICPRSRNNVYYNIHIIYNIIYIYFVYGHLMQHVFYYRLSHTCCHLYVAFAFFYYAVTYHNYVLWTEGVSEIN